MIIKSPEPEQVNALRGLWQQAFGDTDAFLDSFFETAFSSDRCRCVLEAGRPVAALYWFDARFEDRKLAYLYAVATDKAFQGRGLCHSLMEDTHQHLKALGYAGAVLVPGTQSLFRFYETMGYRTFSSVRQFSCGAGNTPVSLRRIGKEEYAALRAKLLPPGGVIQEGPLLTFLEAQTGLYAGDDLVLSASLEQDTLYVQELLGSEAAAPGILAALKARKGIFRTPGDERPFAMCLSFCEEKLPDYFGLALD